MIEAIVQFFLNLAGDLGYWGVFILMTIESSFIPFPSEIVVPPAAYLAARGEMNIYLVILAAVAGSMVGAVVNYALAFWLGRPLVYVLAEKKWAKFLMINKAKLERAENNFRDYGGVSTFFGRLIPVVRQLISIPAGFARMNFWKFLFYTFLGSGIWVIILALLGYFFGANENIFQKYYLEMEIGFVVVTVLVLLFFVFKKILKKKLSGIDSEKVDK